MAINAYNFPYTLNPLFHINFTAHFCIQDLIFDLGDCVRWEFMFPSNEKPVLDVPDMEDDALDFEDDEVINPPVTDLGKPHWRTTHLLYEWQWEG